MRGNFRVTTLGLLVSLTVFAQIGCGNKGGLSTATSENAKIINGEPVLASDKIARSTVALYISIPNSTIVESFCTATIIGQKTLLSAAHCFVEPARQIGISIQQLLPHIRVGFGTKVATELSDTEVKLLAITSVNIHPDYEKIPFEEAGEGGANPDVSVIQLAEAIPADAQVVTLLSDSTKLVIGTNLTLAGFGITSTSPPTVATQLNKVAVTVDNAAINPNQFSYKTTDGRSACSGDSGGPAYLEENGTLYVAGITSWGDRKCSQFGVYTSVPSVTEWIGSQL